MGPDPEGRAGTGRPAVILVTGVVNLVAGFAGACLGGLTFGVGIAGVWFEQPELGAWAIGVAVLVLAKNAALLASGVGLLLGRRWGRALALIYGWWGLIEVCANLLVGRWTTLRFLELEGSSAATPIVILVLLSAFGAVFPSLQLVVAYLPSVRRFFRGEQGGTMSPCDAESS